MTNEAPRFPQPQIDTFEPIPVQDTFSTTLVRIEHIGPCRRLVFAVIEGEPGMQQNTLVGKLVMPAEALPAIAAQLLEHAPAEAALALATAARGAATSH